MKFISDQSLIKMDAWRIKRYHHILGWKYVLEREVGADGEGREQGEEGGLVQGLQLRPLRLHGRVHRPVGETPKALLRLQGREDDAYQVPSLFAFPSLPSRFPFNFCNFNTINRPHLFMSDTSWPFMVSIDSINSICFLY